MFIAEEIECEAIQNWRIMFKNHTLFISNLSKVLFRTIDFVASSMQMPHLSSQFCITQTTGLCQGPIWEISYAGQALKHDLAVYKKLRQWENKHQTFKID